MHGLTDRQRAILRYLYEYRQAKGYMPSIREIGQQFCYINPLRVVPCHLGYIQQKGYLEKDERVPRGIRLTPKALAELGHIERAELEYYIRQDQLADFCIHHSAYGTDWVKTCGEEWRQL